MGSNSTELVTEPPRPRRRTRLALAGALVIAIGAAAIGFAVTRDDTTDRASALSPAPLPILDPTREPGSAGATKIEYRLAGELPDLGSSAPAYLLRSGPPDESTARRIADSLKLEGTPVAVANGWQVADSDEGTLAITRVGGRRHVSFSRGTSGKWVEPRSAADPGIELGPLAQGTGRVLSVDSAEFKAHVLLNELGIRQNHWKVEVHGKRVFDAASCPQDPLPDSEATTDVLCDDTVLYGDADVDLTLVVDDIIVPEVTWTVSLEGSGTIDSFDGAYVEPERIDDYPLRTTQAVYDDLAGAEPGNTSTPETAPGATTTPKTAPDEPAAPTVVTVTDAQRTWLSMLGRDGKTAQHYLVPAYRFVGSYADGSRWETTLVAVADDYLGTPVPDASDGASSPSTDSRTSPSGSIAEAPLQFADLTVIVQADATGGQGEYFEPVELTVELDGQQVIHDEFDRTAFAPSNPFGCQLDGPCGRGGYSYGFDLPPGTYTLDAWSANAKDSLRIEVGETRYYAVVAFDRGEVFSDGYVVPDRIHVIPDGVEYDYDQDQ